MYCSNTKRVQCGGFEGVSAQQTNAIVNANKESKQEETSISYLRLSIFFFVQ